MKAFILNFKSVIRTVCIICMTIIGLAAIIGTGSDDESETKTANIAPVAQIDSPAASSIYTLSNSITFTGSATDTEDLTLTGRSLAWTSSINGAIGTGNSFTNSSLSAGTHQITLTATDSKQLADSTTISITVNPSNNTLPVATITNPSTGTTYNHKNFVEFTGTGYDNEDAWLSNTSLVWISNKDGQLGIGNSVYTNSLTGGTHTISLIATDSFNTSNTASITLIVQNTPPTAIINYPPDGTTFTTGDSIPFDGNATDAEEGNLTGASLVWTASNYGIIGFGTNISVDFLPAGTTVTINLKAIDGGSLVDSDTITITIQ